MSKGTYIYFKDLPAKAEFNLNGMQCRKRSTRTADYIAHPACRWFYFGANDLCIIDRYSALDANYFPAQS